jgi:hypothetical protein
MSILLVCTLAEPPRHMYDPDIGKKTAGPYATSNIEIYKLLCLISKL